MENCSFPSMMEAIALSRAGGLEVIEKQTVPFPKQRPNQMIVKVVWGGVNMLDTYFRKGVYPIVNFPHTLGYECSGVIQSLPVDPDVLDDERYKARGYKVGGRVGVLGPFNAHAEYATAPWTHVFPLPDDIPLDTAAASMLQGITVLTQMTETYEVKEGDILLIHTVAGGLGLLFTAYAKYRGATVIGTTSTPEKAALAKSYGADHVILYPIENTVERVLEITNGKGVHAVYDGVGKDTFMANFDLVRRKGTLIDVGHMSGMVGPISPLKLSAKNLKLTSPSLPHYLVTTEEIDHYTKMLWDTIKSGLFKIRIAGIYPFTADGAREAQQELTTPGGKLAGKILLKISDE